METLDQLIGNLRQRLKQAHRAKRLFAGDPAIAGQVARAIASAPLLPPDVQDGPQQGRKTQWQRIHEYFLSTGNQWAAVADVANATGIKRSVTAQAFYTTHPAEVESAPHPRYQRVKVWRLRGVAPTEGAATGEEKIPGSS